MTGVVRVSKPGFPPHRVSRPPFGFPMLFKNTWFWSLIVLKMRFFSRIPFIFKMKWNIQRCVFESLTWLHLNHLGRSPFVLRNPLFVKVHWQGFRTVEVVEHVQDVIWCWPPCWTALDFSDGTTNMSKIYKTDQIPCSSQLFQVSQEQGPTSQGGLSWSPSNDPEKVFVMTNVYLSLTHEESNTGQHFTVRTFK